MFCCSRPTTAIPARIQDYFQRCAALRILGKGLGGQRVDLLLYGLVADDFVQVRQSDPPPRLRKRLGSGGTKQQFVGAARWLADVAALDQEIADSVA